MTARDLTINAGHETVVAVMGEHCPGSRAELGYDRIGKGDEAHVPIQAQDPDANAGFTRL